MGGNIEVVVIGGGYAGVMAANRLTARDDVTVTVVNPRPSFVPRLRLHQVVGGSHSGTVRYEEVLADRVRLVVDSVARIDVHARVVVLESGAEVGYDRLVYAVGSTGARPAVPGVAEHAHQVAELESAERLRAAVAALPTGVPVTVVGAGPTGIETAAELAEGGRPVTLVCGGVLGPYLHPRARRSAARRFAALGVTVLDGPGTKVTEVAARAVRLADGRTVDGGLTVWTAGFGVPDLAARSGLSTDAEGRLLTDETLTSVDDERIVAAGDCSAPSDLPFRMSAYVAGCLGAHAADTVLARLAGVRPEPVDMSFNAMCLSFGRRTAIFQIAHKDDRAMRIYVGGRAGAKLKELACTLSVKHLTEEAREPGAHSWPKDGGHRPRLLRERTVRTTDVPEHAA
ncbi:NADH dehydrogenase [Streptomyces sp. NE5-10]|uniref:NAD(P)/FAD-dependent oxidoreductase n=1 Tax=Streptomyces sp. NE5-10 TaxID=2759674 RepID=UPI00190357C9|nr:FAD-dependent oxidoreductase [Streptomyces sp. NE5-10]GHJ91962.1 NADH dehydrogenase [Streptomyces sp. NE5-10]